MIFNKKTLMVLYLVIGVLLSLLLLPDFESFELKTLDYRFRFFSQRRVSPDIVLVTIDDETIEAFGYPLSRDFYAALIDILSKAGARVIAFDIFFTDPDRYNPKYDTLLATMTEEAGIVCHAVGFRIMDSGSRDLLQADEMISPLPELSKTSKSLGHINILPDVDGVVRKVPIAIKYGDRVYLSLASQAVADYLRIARNQIRIGEREVVLGKIRIPVNRRKEMIINYRRGGSFREYPLHRILQSFKMLREGDIPSLDLSCFKDKLVFVGVTASGASHLKVSPLAPVANMFEVHAQIATNILEQDFLVKASKGMNLLIPLVFCSLMGILLSKFRPRKAPLIFFASLVAYGLLSLLVFKSFRIWIDMVKPGLVLFLSFIGLVSYQLVVERRRIVEEELTLEEAVSLKIFVDKRIKNFSEEITLLDIDIVNSTDIKEGEDEHDIIYSFGRYHQLLDEIVKKNKGEVFSRAGDGVIYRFQEADHTINAAIEIKGALIGFNKNVNRLKRPIRVRMGVNSGELLIDRDEEGGKVFSQTIDIAGHLQKEAMPDEILITEETFKRLKEPRSFEEGGYIERDRVRVYRYRVS